MASNEMIQYFRGDNNHTIGVMMAIYNEIEDSVSIGWSKCNKKDNFDKVIGRSITKGRILNGSSLEIPSTRSYTKQEFKEFVNVSMDCTVVLPFEVEIPNIKTQYEEFIKRVVTYFKSVSITRFFINSPEDKKLYYESLVSDARNADLDRQLARK